MNPARRRCPALAWFGGAVHASGWKPSRAASRL